MSKFLAAVILGSILLVGVGFGSISLMQKSNAQNMTGNATTAGNATTTGNATAAGGNMTSVSENEVEIVPGASSPSNGKSFESSFNYSLSRNNCKVGKQRHYASHRDIRKCRSWRLWKCI